MGQIILIEQVQEITKLKHLGKTLVLAGGCFDILHAGHIEFLKKAKNLGDHLIILLESDENIKRLKGKNRPINNVFDRATILANLKMIDYVIPLKPLKNDDDYTSIVKMIEPDIIAVTHGDPLIEVKENQAKQVNAKVVVLPKKENYSTSIIAKRFKK